MSPTLLSEWLRDIATTEDDEIDCREAVEAIAAAVELAAAGHDIRSLLPNIAVHLDHCLNCRELFDALVALANESG
jgi:hypothetical protein